MTRLKAVKKNRTEEENSVVDLENARVRLSARARAAANAQNTYAETIDEVQLLLDEGRSNEVKIRLTPILSNAKNNPIALAKARRLLSSALEIEGLYKESLDAVLMYETPESRAGLDAETEVRIRIQVGLAYNYNGNHPKAIGILNAALKSETDVGSKARMAEASAALARVYRSINEYKIARDHSQKALEYYRSTGEWRGVAEAYFGIALADTCEGAYESGLENFTQAIKLVGDRPACHLLGKIYANMAGACWFLKRPHEGINHLEKSISYYERTEHKANAALGYNNLGINLILIGEWRRAHDALKKALFLASDIDENGSKVPTILDSLAELHLLRGDLDEAQSLLERAVSLANKNGNKWYAGQALRTYGRCLLAQKDFQGAIQKGRLALELAEHIGDRQAICESRILIGEACLASGLDEECAEQLELVQDNTSDSATDLGFSGESHRLAGKLALTRKNPTEAAQHFGRSVSIFDMLGDRYRSARAHYELGCAYSLIEPQRASEHLSQAIHSF